MIVALASAKNGDVTILVLCYISSDSQGVQGQAMTSNNYDAIIVGGGNNGLVSAAYFARTGARTLLLEARNRTGGAADTSSPFAELPDVKVSTYSYVVSVLTPVITKRIKEGGNVEILQKPIRKDQLFECIRKMLT